MKNTLKYTSSVLALLIVSVSGHASSAGGQSPQGRTWAAYIDQTAKANNVFASKANRAAADAQLQAGNERVAAANAEVAAQRAQQSANSALAGAQQRVTDARDALNKAIQLAADANQRLINAQSSFNSNPNGGAQGRTWAQYLQQKAAANLSTGSARAIANAQLQAGNQDVASAQNLAAAKSAKESADRAVMEAQRKLKEAQAVLAQIQGFQQARRPQEVAAQDSLDSRSYKPAAQREAPIDPPRSRVNSAPAVMAQGESSRNITAGATAARPRANSRSALKLTPLKVAEVSKKVNPVFFGYLQNGRKSKAEAIDALNRDGIVLTEQQLAKYQKEYKDALALPNGTVELPVAPARA